MADIAELTVQEVVSPVDQSPIQPPSTELLILRVEPASAQSDQVAEVVGLFITPCCIKAIIAGWDGLSPVVAIVTQN